MFGTLSFTDKGLSKNSKAGSFPHGDPGHSTRKFACETCRVHKVKCSGDQLGCARCVGLKVKCVYNRTGKSSSRSSRPQNCRSMSPTAGIELSWSIHNPNKGASHKRHYNELSLAPEKTSDSMFQAGYAVDKPQHELGPPTISPELLTSLPTDEEHSAFQSHTPNSSPYLSDGAAMDFIGSSLEYSDHLDWTFEDDKKPKNAPADLVAYEPFPSTSTPDNDRSTSPGPTLCGGGTQQDASLGRSSPAFEALANRPSSPPNPCACADRLSALLFSLSGYSRWCYPSSSINPTRGSAAQLGQNMSFVFAAHERAARLGSDVLACAPQCVGQGSNTAQLVMLIEQIVDLYAGLLEQLPTVSCARDEQMAASLVMTVPVRVGEYVVESVAERRSLIALLVHEKLKAMTGFSVRFRERLRGASGPAGQCRERLHASIQRLELLRDA